MISDRHFMSSIVMEVNLRNKIGPDEKMESKSTSEQRPVCNTISRFNSDAIAQRYAQRSG